MTTGSGIRTLVPRHRKFNITVMTVSDRALSQMPLIFRAKTSDVWLRGHDYPSLSRSPKLTFNSVSCSSTASSSQVHLCGHKWGLSSTMAKAPTYAHTYACTRLCLWTHVGVMSIGLDEPRPVWDAQFACACARAFVYVYVGG